MWMYLRGKGPRNVHREDKKMRGHSNVTMCEWLINLFSTFAIGWFTLSGPWRLSNIQIKEDVSTYLRGTPTLLSEFILKCVLRPILVLFLFSSHELLKRKLLPPGRWPAESYCIYNIYIASYLALDCTTKKLWEIFLKKMASPSALSPVYMIC